MKLILSRNNISLPIVVSRQISSVTMALLWRHNGRIMGAWNHKAHDCLLNRSFRRRSKKTSKLRVTGLCEGNSPVTGEFPTQKASNAKKIWCIVSINGFGVNKIHIMLHTYFVSIYRICQQFRKHWRLHDILYRRESGKSPQCYIESIIQPFVDKVNRSRRWALQVPQIRSQVVNYFCWANKQHDIILLR